MVIFSNKKCFDVERKLSFQMYMNARLVKNTAINVLRAPIEECCINYKIKSSEKSMFD